MNGIIPVVAAIIGDGSKYGRVLITKRGICECGGGCGLEDRYEFPGGKVDVGETLENALLREIKEELDINLEDIDSQYPPRVVHAQINKYDHSPDYYLVIFMECFARETIDQSKLPEHAWVELDTIENYNPLPGSVKALRSL